MDRNPTELIEPYDFLLKLIVIGESGTGKSSLLYHFLTSTPRHSSPHTIGVEFSSTILSLPSTSTSTTSTSTSNPTCRMKLQLWDTAGQERFRSVTRNYYRGAAGAILVYDITDRSSFLTLSSWLTDVRALGSQDLVVVLVGNKVDLEEEQRQVGELEGSDWAKRHDCLFLETSSLTGESVSTPFLLLTRSILLSIESGRIDPNRTNSGISYGERTLKRVSSWGATSGSGFDLSSENGIRLKGKKVLRRVGLNGKCC
ncbi:P-loop containing nucleoside triphosphate hydrolase protein [Melampsora americana]|nr:P-loop containing nucleoside triphosphate hydrolase protein [Melampsora americana]